MSKADKRKIEELQDENRQLSNKVEELKKDLRYSELSKCRAEKRQGELYQQLQKEKEKYTCLLERYILTMERTVGINEQNSR